jgi:hypothetical protein
MSPELLVWHVDGAGGHQALLKVISGEMFALDVTFAALVNVRSVRSAGMTPKSAPSGCAGTHGAWGDGVNVIAGGVTGIDSAEQKACTAPLSRRPAALSVKMGVATTGRSYLKWAPATLSGSSRRATAAREARDPRAG